MSTEYFRTLTENIKSNFTPTKKKNRERDSNLQKFQRAWDSIIVDSQTESNWGKDVANTDIPKSLNVMVDILVKEKSSVSDGGVEAGGCTELFLNDDMLAHLVKISENDLPEGFRGAVIHFLNNIVSLLDHTLMIQNAIHRPTLSLIRSCLAEKERRNEEEMLELEAVLTAKIHEFPQLLYIFFSRSFVPKNVTPESFAAGQAFTAVASNRLIPLAEADSAANATGGHYEFSIFEHILRYVHLEGSAGDFARQSVLNLIDLATGDLAAYISQSDFTSVAVAGLGGLYSQLPPVMPRGVAWGEVVRSVATVSRRSPIDVFKSDMVSFIESLKFVQDVLLKCPNTAITAALLADLKATFLDNIVQSSITSASDFDGTTVTALYYLHQMLHVVKEDQFSALFANFLLLGDDSESDGGSNPDDENSRLQTDASSPVKNQELSLHLRDILISKLTSLSEEVVTATLNLIQTLLSQHSVHSLHLLIEKLPKPISGLQGPRYQWQQKASEPGIKSVESITTDVHDHLSLVARYFALVPADSSITASSPPANDVALHLSNVTVRYETTLAAYMSDAESAMKVHSSRHQRARASPPIISSRKTSLPPQSFEKGTSPLRRAVSDGEIAFSGLLDSNSPIREAMIELGKDSTLRKFMAKLSNFFSHSFEINLALTGVISQLASSPVPLMYMYLFASDVLLGPSFPSLHTILVRLRREVEERRVSIEGFDSSLARTRESLFRTTSGAQAQATSSSDWLRGKKAETSRTTAVPSSIATSDLDLDEEFLKNVVVLEEATKELLAIIIMHGSNDYDAIDYL